MKSLRITKVRAHLITARWTDDPWFTPALHSAALIRIETDGGIDGWGEATVGYFSPESVPPMVEFFEPILVGQDAMDITRLTRAMYDESVWWARNGAGRSVISGIELALWDAKGKALGVPVYQLLGGKARERVPVYASGGASIWPIEENARKLTFYASQNYRAAKLSTGFHQVNSSPGGQTREVARTFPFATAVRHIRTNFEMLRRELGDDFDLAIDGHQGGVPDPIPVTEAIATVDALAALRLRFYEEPLAYTDVEGYVELRSRSSIPIAAGESLSGLDQFHALIHRQGVHLVQPDIGFVGGLEQTLRIMHHAEAFNISTAMHTGGSIGPALAASWHLAAARTSVLWLEHVVASRALHREFLTEEFTVRDGTVGVPGAPGLGVAIDLEKLERYSFVPGSGERT